METNEAALDAQADIQRRQNPGSQSGTHRGEHATLVANGGVLSDPSIDEDTPLLSRNDRDLDETADATAQTQDDPGRWRGLDDFEGLPWWKTPSIYWLLGPFLLFTLAFGGIFAARINLITDLLCRQYYSRQALIDPNLRFDPITPGGDNNEQCNTPEVLAIAANFTLAANLVGGLLSAITSPKLGALSDRYGRTKLLALTSVGMLVQEAITIAAAMYPDTISVYWLFVGFIMDGICGTFIAGMAIANAYAADCTPPSRRNVTFGYFHAILFTGVAIGPFIAGQIIKATGSLISIFYVAFGCHVVFTAFLLLVLPESLSKARQRAAREKHLLRFPDSARGKSKHATFVDFMSPRDFLTPFKVLYPTGPGTSTALRRNLILLALVDFIMFGVAFGAITVVMLYIRTTFDWDTVQQNNFLSVVNIGRVVCLFAVLPAMTRLFRGPASKNNPNAPPRGCDTLDVAVIRLGVLFDTLGYLGYCLAKTGPLFMASGVVAAIGGIASPTLQASLTKHIPHDRTGQLLGASGLLHALARVAAPTVFNAIFSVTVKKGMPQVVFICLTATFGCAFLLTWFLKKGIYLDEEHIDANEAEVPGQEPTPEVAGAA